MMIATSPATPALSARPPLPRFMPGSSVAKMARASRSHRPRALPCRRSADLAGRAVRLSPAVPAGFDAPLAPHHRIIGQWAARHAPVDRLLTRAEARRHIERSFQQAVLDIIGVNTLADLRVTVLAGDGDTQPPAIAIICDSVGQIDMGWIERTNVLADTLNGFVAPVGWRARAYGALNQLAAVLPMFDFDGMMEELSGFYWDGETEDEAARHALVVYHGHDPDDVMLPSQIRDRRPDYMLRTNADPLKALPRALQAALRRVEAVWNAVQGCKQQGDAWHFDFEQIVSYLPEYEDVAPLPALTIVPYDVYAQELDQIGQAGMECGFHNVCGLCPLTGPDVLDQWFASLRRGAELIAAVQDLIDLDVSKVRS